MKRGSAICISISSEDEWIMFSHLLEQKGFYNSTPDRNFLEHCKNLIIIGGNFDFGSRGMQYTVIHNDCWVYDEDFNSNTPAIKIINAIDDYVASLNKIVIKNLDGEEYEAEVQIYGGDLEPQVIEICLNPLDNEK